MVTNIPTFTPTQEQREWAEKEKKRTGNSFSTIMKGLLQEKVDKEKRARK